MGIERHFFDWHQPLLPQAVSFLWNEAISSEGGFSEEGRLENGAASRDKATSTATDSLHSARRTTANNGELDLSQFLVVVPSSEAGRHLRELLLERVATTGLRWRPPEITTVGGLPELLYQALLPFATPLTQELTWYAALRETPLADLEELVHDPPPIEQREYWMEISQLLSKLARELANDGLRFEDVWQLGQQSSRDGEGVGTASEQAEAFPEAERWRVLTDMQARYLKLLDQLEQWDRQTARLVAIERGSAELHSDRRIVLLGTVDLSQSMRQMLDRLDARIDALVFTDDANRTGFDSHGCLRPKWWIKKEIDVPSENIVVADSPLDQAAWVVEFLAQWGVAADREAISVGLADGNLVAPVKRKCDEVGQPTHWAGGLALNETLPYRFLDVVANYLKNRWFNAFASMVRHPDVKSWVSQRIEREGWLSEVDRFQNQRLPLEFHREFFQQAGSATKTGSATRADVEPDLAIDPDMEGLLDAVESLLSELLAPELSWADCWVGIRQVLHRLYGEQIVNRESQDGRLAYASLKDLSEALQELAAVPPSLTFSIAPADGVRMLLQRVASGSLIWPPADDELTLHGWLDMPWDMATHAVVAGFNEGIVPASEPADLFLPDRIRARLGLLDNQRRYSRDAYALSLLQSSRQDLRLIVGRRDSDQNPLAPSRLLFATTPVKIGPRAKHLFQEPPPSPIHSRAATNEWELAETVTEEGSRFAIPRPPLDAPILTELSVTRFRDYLICPYRFYLSHILRLQSIDDRAEEIEGNVFGTLMHRILDRFGKSKHSASTDAEQIEEYLHQLLDRETKRWFSDLALPTVPVQIAQLRARLTGFAEKQAARSQDGWRIWMTEVKDLGAEFDVDGEPFRITGQIDRIDIHEPTGKFALLDYKSSDAAKSPESLHREKGEWVNLQLPLYRHLARELEELDGEIEMGYFVLPKEVDQVAVLPTKWGDSELTEADEKAREVIRCLRARLFWPPKELKKQWDDPLDGLCQVGILDRAIDATD